MKCRDWIQKACTDTGEAFLFEYDFAGVVEEEWSSLTVNAEVSKSLIPKWANWLWKEEWCSFNLSHAHWRCIEKITFNETKILVEEKLQRGTFRNGTTIQLKAPISLPLDIDSLNHPND